MISPDIALATLINRAGTAYQTTAPTYITYRETTHVEGANRAEDINRSVSVRVADDYAVMQDLPQGAVRLGSAFPVIPFFDPFSTFRFSYYANLKKIDITFTPGQPFYFTMPVADPNVSVVVPYISFYAPHYAPDSTEEALHMLIDPTPRIGGNEFYPSDVREDATSHLPSQVTMRMTDSDMTLTLDFSTVQGHWVITQGAWSATQHVLGMTFRVAATTTYTDFAFPTTAPDVRLAGTPRPSPTPSP